jgi:hypothetical protein
MMTVVSQPPRVTRWVFAAGLTVWVANALIRLFSAYPLGHDEAQYALAARDMFAGAEPRWFYVSRGMNAIAGPGVLAGGSECALRFVPFVFGIGFVLATWQLARRTVGEATAAWTVAVLAGSRSYIGNSVELLSDMPAAACLIAATAMIAGELSREDGPRWRVVLVAPLLSAALYIRYGSCVPIAILAVLAGVLGWRTIGRRPAPVVVTGLVFVALFVPHAVMAIRTTGSPFGVLLDSKSVPLHRSMLDGLVTYVTSNPIVFYGILSPPVMLAGLFAVRRERRIGLLWLAAIADIVALGMITHAQVRYIFFGTALLVILGTDVIRRMIAAQAPRVRTALGAFAIAATVTAWVTVTFGSIEHRARRAASIRGTLAAAEAIRSDAKGSPCHVMGDPYTQLEWYGGCSSTVFSLPDAFARAEPVYVVDKNGAGFYGLPGRHRSVLDIPGVVHVIRLDAAI